MTESSFKKLSRDSQHLMELSLFMPHVIIFVIDLLFLGDKLAKLVGVHEAHETIVSIVAKYSARFFPF